MGWAWSFSVDTLASPMSDVFISYARSTRAAALKVAEALRGLGYEVWLDDQMPAHRAFADVIEERLRAAKSVVVIWSEDAVKSQWVRAEAELAREGHKLVQLKVDGARLPMPFNQIQFADLSAWTGEGGDPAWRQVTASIAELTAGTSTLGAVLRSEPAAGRPAAPSPTVAASEASPEDDLRRVAARHADAEIGLRKHAVTYVAVNVGFVALNLITDPHELWFQWPLIGWGIGLAAQALSVYRLRHEGRREEIIARKLRQMRPPDL
jgi:hypothetical protein